MADDKIIVQIELDDGSIKQGFLKIENQAEDTAKKMGDGFKKSGTGELEKGLAGINVGLVAIGAAALGAAAGITKLFSAGIQEAVQAEEAVNRLSSALALQGKFSEEAVESFSKYASELSKITGIDDDIIVSNAGLLASLGNLSGKGLEQATRAALDLAQATGKDLSGVTQALAKAASGSTEALGRYSVKIDESIPKNERFAAALKQIEDRFGGLANSRINTFSGALDLITNSFNDVIKVFGQLITQSPVLRAVLKTTGELIAEIADKIGNFFKGKDPFGDAIKSALRFAQFLATNVLPPVEIFFNFFKTGALVIASFASGLVFAFVKIYQVFNDTIVIPVINFFTRTLASVIAPFSQETADKLTSIGERYVAGTKAVTDEAVKITGELFDSTAGALVDSTNSVLDTKVSDATSKLIARYQAAADEAKKISLPNQDPASGLVSAFTGTEVSGPEFGPQNLDAITSTGEAFTTTLDGMDKAAEEFAFKSKENFRQVGATMFQTLGTGAANAFASFGKAVATGKNALGAFLNALLATFGQAAISLGTQFILQGTAYLFAGLPNGGSLIAAGAALATFGGLLSALGGADASVGVGAGGASVSSGGFQSPLNPELSNPTQQPANQNTLIVQGDVLIQTEREIESSNC